MLDIHTHILPGLDDGPRTFEGSVAMAKAFMQTGVTGVVATPHFIWGSAGVEKEKVLVATAALNEYLQEQGVYLKVYPGMEIELCYEIPALLKEGKVLTINGNGKYILIELPFLSLPPFTTEVFYELRLLGVTPVLAHPERNVQLAEDIGLIYEMIRRGVLMQVNGGSLLGYFGGKVRRVAAGMLERNLVHVVGGDAHAPEGERGPTLHLVDSLLQKLVGEEMANQLTKDNPQTIITGAELSYPEPKPPKERRLGFLHKIFSR